MNVASVYTLAFHEIKCNLRNPSSPRFVFLLHNNKMTTFFLYMDYIGKNIFEIEVCLCLTRAYSKLCNHLINFEMGLNKAT